MSNLFFMFLFAALSFLLGFMIGRMMKLARHPLENKIEESSITSIKEEVNL
jgi:hypothetical protein